MFWRFQYIKDNALEAKHSAVSCVIFLSLGKLNTARSIKGNRRFRCFQYIRDNALEAKHNEGRLLGSKRIGVFNSSKIMLWKLNTAKLVITINEPKIMFWELNTATNY